GFFAADVYSVRSECCEGAFWVSCTAVFWACAADGLSVEAPATGLGSPVRFVVVIGAEFRPKVYPRAKKMAHRTTAPKKVFIHGLSPVVNSDCCSSCRSKSIHR